MDLYSIHFAFTKYVRKSTSGGMDSEFSHTERDETYFNVIAPNYDMAELLLKQTGGHSSDKEFKIIRHTVTKVDAIIGISHGLGFITRGS